MCLCGVESGAKVEELKLLKLRKELNVESLPSPRQHRANQRPPNLKQLTQRCLTMTLNIMIC